MVHTLFELNLFKYIFKIIVFKNTMASIDKELLKKSAEHNEGCLTDLEEISLHQRELVKIENLDKLTRHLKILYL